MRDMPSGYADATAKSRRLATLRVLRECHGAANESMLRTSLHQLGFRGRFVSEDALGEDARVLAEARLVKQDFYQGRVMLLEITRRGLAFLNREIDPVPGVEYPDVA